MDEYPQDLPGFMKLMNNYITKSGKNRNLGKIFGKEKTGVDFNQTQDKDVNTTRKVKSHCFHCINQDNWASEWPDLEEEYRRKVHTNSGTVKYDVDEEGDTTEVSFLKSPEGQEQKKMYPNRIYLGIHST